MYWIKESIVLQGNKVVLKALEETHFEALIDASQEEIIWNFMPVKGSDKEKLKEALKEALLQKEKGEQYPFVVFDRLTDKIIGSTRFLKLNQEHRNLEIGWTWYAPSYWGKGFNEECKLLLLKYSFEILQTIRVQITAAEKNQRSRRAIERIGANFEGILRHVVIRNGEKRSAAYYSILEEEWPSVKKNIEQLLLKKQ